MSASEIRVNPLPGTGQAVQEPVGVGGSGDWLRSFGESVAEETVSLGAGVTDNQKKQILELAGLCKALQSAAEFENWNTAARGKLRVYRLEVERRLDQLKADLDSTGAALQEAMTLISQNSEDQTKQLQTELGTLDKLRNVQQIEEVHKGIDQVSHNLNDVLRCIQVQNSLVVAQMRDEIRTLQQRLEIAERRNQNTPGNLSHRGPFERKIKAKIAAGDTFALFLVRITNWKQTLAGLSQDRAQTLTNEVSTRLGNVLGSETFAGRWYDGYFAAIVTGDKRQAIGATQSVVQGVSGQYKLSTNPAEKAVQISTRVAVIEHYQGQEAEQLLKRVDELIRAFEGNAA